MDRLDVVLTPEEDQDPHLILDELIADMQRLSNNAASWNELCLVVVSGTRTAVRRFYADGSERTDRTRCDPEYCATA